MKSNIRSMTTPFLFALLSASCAWLSGCYLDSGDQEDEAVDEAEAAFTEATCGTIATPDDTVGSVSCGGGDNSVSTSATYGEPSCTSGWLVSATGAYSDAYATVAAGNTTDVDTQAECVDTRARIRRLSSAGALLADKTYHGSWSNGPFFTGCLMLDNNNQQVPVGIATGDRFVVQAYRQSTGAFLKVALVVYGDVC
ncbi:hypothetical protein [Sorangium sp. So ce1000]|uniref:hypothetical protein n=1 Tax=Sorangium sp. So ce1000 TaxID=3133325 RepID=UPI003F5E21A2